MPPEALQGVETMTDTLTPDEAARILKQASTYEEALAERTGGLTWMVWGIVTPGIFLTYSFFAALGQGGWWLGVAWIPWVAMGIGTTMMLWRSAALAAPKLDSGHAGIFWLKILAFTAFITIALFLVPADGPELPLLVVGSFWAGMGLVNLWGGSTFSRAVAIAAGAPLILAGAAMAITGTPPETSRIVALLVSGAAPFLAGLYQTLRG